MSTLLKTTAYKTIVAEEIGDNFDELAVILAQDAGAAADVPQGLVLGKVTATGKYAAYSNVAVDGTEVAKAILFYPVAQADTVAGDVRVGALFHGAVKIDQLTGYDAAAAVDLGATITGNKLSF